MGAELDEVTLVRARRGDPAAQTALVTHYERPVFALVARLAAGRGGPVEDLAQEAFIRVLRSLPRFDPDGPARLSSWILTIATRVCLNAVRDGRRRQAAAAEPSSPIDPSDPEQALAERQRGARVRAAMEALPEEMRAVLVLRAFHDFDYDQIAAALDLELGTVKSRLARARTALREALNDEEHERDPRP